MTHCCRSAQRLGRGARGCELHRAAGNGSWVGEWQLHRGRGVCHVHSQREGAAATCCRGGACQRCSCRCLQCTSINAGAFIKWQKMHSSWGACHICCQQTGCCPCWLLLLGLSETWSGVPAAHMTDPISRVGQCSLRACGHPVSGYQCTTLKRAPLSVTGKSHFFVCRLRVSAWRSCLG